MLSILIQSLLLASGGILSVGSITIVTLLLISDEGWRNGAAYMLGYVGAYTLIGLASVWVGATAARNEISISGIFSSILFLVLGTVLLWISQRNWRKESTEPSESARIFDMLDSIAPIRAFALGAVITVVNFKNLAIFLSALSVVLLSDLSLLLQILIALLIVFVFCLSVIAPVLIYLLFPRSASRRLNWIKALLETNRRPIGIWIPLFFALIFLTLGISNLL